VRAAEGESDALISQPLTFWKHARLYAKKWKTKAALGNTHVTKHFTQRAPGTPLAPREQTRT